MVTVNLYPVANGSYQQCYSQYPSSGYHWDKLSTNDGLSSYVDSARYGGTTLYETYKFTFPAGIYSQVVLTFVAKYVYGTYGHYSNIGAHVRSGGSGYSEPLEPLWDAGWTTYTYTYNQNPVTGLDWGVIDGNDVEFGFKGWQCCNNENILVTQLYLTVTYIPIGGGGAQIIGLELL